MNGSNSSLIIIAIWLIVVFLCSFGAKKFLPSNNELSRKIVHIGTGPIIPIAWFLEISSRVAISFALIITISLLINYKLKIIPNLESIERKSFGTIAYAFSITLLISLFWIDNPASVCAGVLMMAFGDGLAGLIGRGINSPSWKVIGQKKSLAGTLTMAIVGAITLSVIHLVSSNDFEPLSILLITFLGVGLEQISPFGIDNLSVPIGVALAWQLL